MDVRPILTDEDHRTALAEIEANWGAPAGSPEGERLDMLLALIETYEAQRWLIELTGLARPLSVDDVAVKVSRLGLMRRDEAARLIREGRDR